MSRAIRLIVLAFCCAALVPSASRAGPEIVNQINGVGLIDYGRKPDFEVGTWVQYRVSGSSEMGMEDDYMVTLLIAGEETFWGEDCFWVETWTEPANRPPSAVAALMSYAIFEDSLALTRTKLYMRRLITGITDEGQPIQTVSKRPSGSLTSRRPPIAESNWVVDTLGADTVVVPRGTFNCLKVLMRQGIGSNADVGDSTIRTEVRETRTIYVNPEIPLTSVAREDMENSIERKSWKIGESRDAPLRTMDRALGVSRLVDFGVGLTPQLVPEHLRQPIQKGRRGASTSKRKR